MKDNHSISFLWRYSNWRLKKAWQDLNQIDLIAFAIVFLPVLILFFVNVPLEQYLDTQTKAIKSVKQEENNVESLEIKLQPLQSEKMSDQFILFLPDESTKNEQLLKIHFLINKNKLTLENIHYQNEAIKNTPIKRLKVQMRLVGDYNQQRKFLFGLLNEMPNLAIHQLLVNNNPDQKNLSLDVNLYYKTIIRYEVIQDGY